MRPRICFLCFSVSMASFLFTGCGHDGPPLLVEEDCEGAPCDDDGCTEPPPPGECGDDGCTEPPPPGECGDDGCTEPPPAGECGDDGCTEPPPPGGCGEGGCGPGQLATTQGNWMGQAWSIDAAHMMWWAGQPFIPYGAFSPTPDNTYGLDFANVWIDGDLAYGRTLAEQVALVNQMIGDYCAAGIGVQVQMSTDAPDNLDASTLFDPAVRQRIFQSWRQFAGAFEHDCLRGITLWNEINVWSWPETYSPSQYGESLGGYAAEMRAIIAPHGQLPIVFKVAGDWNSEAVVEGAKRSDGLLVDIWPSKQGHASSAWSFRRLRELLEDGQAHTTWFFVGEAGKGLGEGCGVAVQQYWDNWPPFVDYQEALGILTDYARWGAKGMIYNGPLNSGAASCSYADSYGFLQQAKSTVVDLMIEIGRDVDFGNVGTLAPPWECGPTPACLGAGEGGSGGGGGSDGG